MGLRVSPELGQDCYDVGFFRMRWIAIPCLVLALAAQTRTPEGRVQSVHRGALLIDTHNDLPWVTTKGAVEIRSRLTRGHTDIPRLREGGVGAVFFAAYVPAATVAKKEAAHVALERIDYIRHGLVGAYSDVFDLATSAGEILAARKRGKIAALIGVEGGHAIEDSLGLLRAFYDLGVRYMTLAHTNHNGWADSSGSAGSPNHGLSPFGRQVVAEMNRLGMLVDISHVADKTFWDVMDTAKAPPIASHSSCRAISKIPRNLSDDMIVALARKGGTIQINFGCEFLSQTSADTSSWSNPALKGKKKEGDMVRATLADVVAQIDHAVHIAGEDAVGIGTDFDGISCAPAGLDDVSKFPALTQALLDKGYTESRIHKIYGGNLLRVLRAAEQHARSRAQASRP